MYTGNTSKRTSKKYLKNIMEQEIMRIAKEYKKSAMANATDTDDINGVSCTSSDKNTCV
jgi:hypothetical protein